MFINACMVAFCEGISAQRKHLARVLTLATVFAACGLDGQAALVWPQQEIRLQVAADTAVVPVAFTFRNAGREAVRIISVQSDCDCTTTQLAKEKWSPGEAGEIAVTMVLQGRTGRLERRVRVTTDDAPEQPVVLTFFVEVPEVVSITPRFLSWAVDGSADERWVSIVFSDPQNMRIDEIRCDSPWFQTRLEPTGQPGNYRLGVRPKDGAPTAQVGIQIRATIANRPKTFIVYALKK